MREGLGAINAVHLGVRSTTSLLLPRLTHRLVDPFPCVSPQMPNLSALEITELRPFFSLSFQRLRDLDPLAEQHRETEEWWMRDPAGCMDAARQGMFGRQGREGTEVSGFGGYGGF